MTGGSERAADRRSLGSTCDAADLQPIDIAMTCLACLPTSRQIPHVRPTVAEPTSSAETDGIRVRVQSHYLADQSSPREDRYVFAYTITISNESQKTAQLRTRHWIITDGRGTIEEVRGDGVVGEQPKLAPGQTFQYTSGCVLTTPIGTMHGSYRFWRDDGTYFDAEIATFSLASPVRNDDAN